MHYAIVADIHSNLAAFEAVLADIEAKGGCDQIWCLGDVVGYGPDPRECIALLRKYEHLCIAGNHDWAAINKIDTSYFNPVAAQACYWTARQLTSEDMSYLENLPLSLCRADFTLVHGSPREPIWEYLLSVRAAQDNFGYFGTSFCLIGHSHVPLVFEYVDELEKCTLRQLQAGNKLELGKNRLIINPGSVGQPRDGDPRASYGIYDNEARIFYHYRVEYDIATTQKRMMEAGLPLPLILRLSQGI